MPWHTVWEALHETLFKLLLVDSIFFQFSDLFCIGTGMSVSNLVFIFLTGASYITELLSFLWQLPLCPCHNVLKTSSLFLLFLT